MVSSSLWRRRFAIGLQASERLLPARTCWCSSKMLFIIAISIAAAATTECPTGATLLATFTAEGSEWTACEDLQTPDGVITLVPATGAPPVLLPKSHHPYMPAPDSDYYLGIAKDVVAKSQRDELGEKLLQGGSPTWAEVEAAVPPIRRSGGGGAWCTNCDGLRTFVGSRSSSTDATLSDLGHDCSWVGMPSVQSYVMNLTIMHEGEPPFADFKQYVNTSAVADGLVGGVKPVVVLYFPLVNGSSRLQPGEVRERV